MKTYCEGNGDLGTNARPTLQMTASDGQEAAVIMRFGALVARGHSPMTILMEGVECIEQLAMPAHKKGKA